MPAPRRSRLNLPAVGAWTVTLALLALVLAPVAVVVVGAFLTTPLVGVVSEGWITGEATGTFTLRWFGYVAGLYREQLFFSAQLAVGSVAGCLFLGVPGGYALARGRFPGRPLLEELVSLPLALPGIALAIGLIQAYAVVRGRWELILVGHLVYTVPFMVRTTAGALRGFDAAGLERAARSLGAGFWQRFFLVILPNLRHAMLVGALLAFALSWGEFNVSYLLNTPRYQTYPAALYATYTFNSFQVSSAATTLFLLIVVPALVLIQLLGGERRLEIGQGA